MAELTPSGPLTRGRRRALESAGLTPRTGAADFALTPNLLGETEHAPELFGSEQGDMNGSEAQEDAFSPTQNWQSNMPSSDQATPTIDLRPDTFKMPDVTSPDLGAAHKPAVGATPANTPAMGVPIGTSMPGLIGTAVNELQAAEAHAMELEQYASDGPSKQELALQSSNDETGEGLASPSAVVAQWSGLVHAMHNHQLASPFPAAGTGPGTALVPADEAADSEASDADVQDLVKCIDEIVLAHGTPEAYQSGVTSGALGSLTPIAAGTPSTLCDETPGTTVATPGSTVVTPGSAMEEPGSMEPRSHSVPDASDGMEPDTPSEAYDKQTPMQIGLNTPEDAQTPPTVEVDVTPEPASPVCVAEEAAVDTPTVTPAAHQKGSSMAHPVAESPRKLPAASEQAMRHDSPSVASITATAGSPVLGALGREDELPTPAPFKPVHHDHHMPQKSSPATPDSVAFKPLSFTASAGSRFATPEVHIASGVTPMTMADVRHAAKHIPAWHRVEKLVQRTAPLVYRQVHALLGRPQTPTWAKTPSFLLQELCRLRGWTIDVRNQTEARLGVDHCILTTVNMPGRTGGHTITSTAKNPGRLEAVILSAAYSLEQLLSQHLVVGKDIEAAITKDHSALAAARAVGNVGHTPHPAAGPHARVAFGRNLGAAKPPLPQRPPMPQPSGAATAATAPAAEPESPVMAPPKTPATPATQSPHPGVGVRAPMQQAATPELVPMNTPVTAKSKASASPVIYHPPMRTGMSRREVPNKSDIAALAKGTGRKALQEHEENMKKQKKLMDSVTAKLGKFNIASASSPAPLHGVSTPKGKHVRFDDDGMPHTVERKALQRGMKKAQGTHVRFDSDGEENA